MNGKWQKINSRYAHKSPWVNLRVDEVIKPDGERGEYNVVEIGKGALVIPVAGDGKIWMLKIYRYIFDDYHWELVAGDTEGEENEEQAAHRELIEELGMKDGELTKLGEFRPSGGSTNQACAVFLAEGLTPEKSSTNEYDIVDRKTFSIAQIDEMIKSGEIQDGYVMNALYFYKLWKLIN